MDKKECCIPGHEGQEMLIFTHRHWASLLKTIFLVGLFFILPIIILILIFFLNRELLNGLALNFIIIATSSYYMVITTFAFTEWISFYYNILAVTQSEVIEINQNGIFDRRITEISTLRIQDVSADIGGFWPTLFGYGDVVVESAGDNTQKYIIKDIPRPMEVANEILKLHNEQIAREERRNEVAIGEGDFRKTPTNNQPPAPPLNQTPEDGSSPTSSGSKDQDYENSSGEFNKEDLDKGGEIKF